MAFIVFRQGLSTLQGVLLVKENVVSINMVKWALRLNLESVVIVHGHVQRPQDGQKEIRSCTVHNAEVLIDRVSQPIPAQRASLNV